MTIKLNNTLVRVIETKDEIKDCSFSNSTATNNGYKRFWLDRKIKITQYICRLINIFKTDISESDLSLDITNLIFTFLYKGRSLHNGCYLANVYKVIFKRSVHRT